MINNPCVQWTDPPAVAASLNFGTRRRLKKGKARSRIETITRGRQGTGHAEVIPRNFALWISTDPLSSLTAWSGHRSAKTRTSTLSWQPAKIVWRSKSTKWRGAWVTSPLSGVEALGSNTAGCGDGVGTVCAAGSGRNAAQALMGKYFHNVNEAQRHALTKWFIKSITWTKNLWLGDSKQAGSEPV